MKKIVLLVSAGLLSSFITNAQGKFGFGVRFNPEFSAILNRDDAAAGDELNYEHHFSARSLGIGASYNITTHFGIALDVLFSREGQAFSGDFKLFPPNSQNYSSVVATQLYLNNEAPVGTYTALAELNYIKVPLMLSISSNNEKSMYFTLLTGPQINFLTGVAQEVNGEDHDYPNTSITPDKLYKPVTFSGMLAVGEAFKLGSHLLLTTRVRIDYSFSDVEQKDVMVSYYGAAPVKFYSGDRRPAHSITGGLMIGLDYKF